MNKTSYLVFWFLCLAATAVAQGKSKTENYLEMNWRQVAVRMADAWYGSDDAKRVAENVLLCQKDVGGWAKNKPLHHIFTDGEKAEFEEAKGEVGATIDNGATTTEMIFLAKVYEKLKDERYKQAFMKALDYLFVAQHDNGGWPQFYPARPKVPYSSHITYNDDAMTHVMILLHDILEGDKTFAALSIDATTKAKAQKAFDKGIECILKTQIVVNGTPTVWCAQHDEKTFAPANARAYELASFSGAESADIVFLLMQIKNPSKEVIAAVDHAVVWFESHKINGIRIDNVSKDKKKKNRVVVEDPQAEPVWARFYDLETEKPYFCDRDGIKKNSLAEIGDERRNGYSWYVYTPAKVLKKYSKWKAKVSKQ